MKTAELTGAALDWAVAKCEGLAVSDRATKWRSENCPHLYSTEWALSGPIIERQKITVAPFYDEWVAASCVGELVHDSDGDCMTIAMWKSEPHFYGSTPLIAAMRCYVASKLGNEVEALNDLNA